MWKGGRWVVMLVEPSVAWKVVWKVAKSVEYLVVQSAH